MPSICVSSPKGGTGKSTTAIGLAIEISKRLRDRKERVALIDGDRHIKTTELKLINIRKSDPRLDDVLDGKAKWQEAVYGCDLKSTDTGELLYPNLIVMPAGANFLSISELDLDLERVRAKVDKFSDLVDELKERCSFVIIDTPASFSLEHAAMIAAADGILPVVNPNDDSINSTLEMIAAMRGLIDYVDVVGCVLNRVPERMDADPWVKRASEIGEVLGIVPQDRYVDLAFSENWPVAALYPNAPSVRAIRSLAERLLGVVVPETKLSIVSKLDRTIDVLAREELRRRMREGKYGKRAKKRKSV